MKDRKIRVGPWDCDEKLLDRVSLYRTQQGGKAWTWVLHKALNELMDREQVFIGAHANTVESVSNLAPVSISGVPAAVVPAVQAVGVPAVELSPNEKRLERLYAGRALKQEFWDQGIIELAADPGNVRAANWVRVMPGEVESYNAEIKVCEALIAAEKLAKENSGEVVPGEEV